MKCLLKIIFLLLVFDAAYGQKSIPNIWAYGTDSALVITKRILLTEPNNAAVRHARAQALLNNKENEAAHSELLYALDCLKNSNIEQYNVKGIGDMLYFTFKDYKSASKTADYILANSPNNIEGMEIKARSLQRMGLDDDAIKMFQSLLEYAPRKTKFELYVIGGYSSSLGDSYENKREYFKAIQHYTNAIEFGYDNELPYNSRGRCKTFLSDFRGAILDFDSALAKFSEKNDFYYSILNRRTYAKGALKRYAEVITDATNSINSAKDKSLRAYAYYLRGDAKHELKNNAGACLDWSKAGELGEEEVYAMIKQFCK
ncbi:tetratricopeptide repeat protein [Hymenobacter rubidus]|uniref:tetratricopeptide repeat protein n=1 Tax=Hymenobacter rubidus TaxID=1441626 RepID=UPI00191CCF72|nr:hypothetical protein [Hymenobacter rubidus]